jgi:hypothetical protein
MIEMSGRRFAGEMVAVALGAMLCLALLAAPAAGAAGEAEAEGALKVPMEVSYVPAWLTWVSSTTGCLNALGVDCDAVDVAGYSGYAFVMSVAEDLCPSGPTVFDWGLLVRGITGLGRSAHAFWGEGSAEDPDHCRTAYDLVASEVKAGRPCVLWGTYVPEFGIAVGVHDDKYLVRTFKPFAGEPEPPIPFDELQAPGGVYVLTFPAAVKTPKEETDRSAIHHAVEMLNHTWGDPEYRMGREAYDFWIAALEADKADAFGNSYNAQCWAEAKRFARDFVGRLAARNENVAEPLHRAQVAYAEAADAMGKVAQLFHFPDTENKVGDPENRAKAVAALKVAKAADERAATAMAEAAKLWPKPSEESDSE